MTPTARGRWATVALSGAILLGALWSVSCSETGQDNAAASGVGSEDSGHSGGDAAAFVDSSATDASLSDAGSGGGTGACTGGDRKCVGAHSAAVCVKQKWVLEEVCQSPKQCKDGYCAEPADCKPGEGGGCHSYDQRKVCSSDGKGWIPLDCETGQLCVLGVCKKTACVPGVAICDGKQHYKTCTPDGSAYGKKVDCKSGAYCLGGKCVSLCEQNLKVASHVGCEYWSADLDNYDDITSPQNPKKVPHSIVISNPGIFDATIKFDAKPPWQITVSDPVVKAGESREFKMPVMNVDGNSISAKGIHLTSTQPVVAYQFNPFNADKAYSNDGSLLIPHNALGKEYFVLTRPSGVEVKIPNLPSFAPQQGYFSVLATRPGATKVTVTISGTGYVKKAPNGIPLNKNQTAHFELQQYEVLNLEAHSTLGGIRDLTGTRIVANQPVAVFGGHEELVQGYDGGAKDTCCAEHVEEQLLPVSAWGTSALCPKTRPRGAEKDIWVVMSSKPGVTVKTTPPIKGLDGHTFTAAGQWLEVQTDKSFELSASGKVQVGQFIVSRDQTDQFTGDPTFLVHPPSNQLRADYFILTPKGYKQNFASVIRPKGLKVLLDGTEISSTLFQPLGSGNWQLAYIELKPGMHRLEAAAAFGLSVYGYGNATAYGYPGGMNLK